MQVKYASTEHHLENLGGNSQFIHGHVAAPRISIFTPGPR